MRKTTTPLFFVFLLTLSVNAWTMPFTVDALGSWGDSEYLLIGAEDGSAISWTGSQAMAESLGGNLVTINSEEENSWLVEVLSALDSRTVDEVWIGLTDQDNESYGQSTPELDGWAWIAGPLLTETGFQAWNIGGDACEPTNGNLGCGSQTVITDVEEDFVFMAVANLNQNFLSGEWNDIPDSGYDQIQFAVVEVTRDIPVPTPATLVLLSLGLSWLGWRRP